VIWTSRSDGARRYDWLVNVGEVRNMSSTRKLAKACEIGIEPYLGY
jgi:hypothetical protein